MEVHLPDCTELEFRITLSPEEEEELLQEIARSGKEGLTRFSERYSALHKQDGFGINLQRYRDRLEKQASKMLEKRRRALTGQEEERKLGQFRELDEFRKQRPHILADLDRIEIMDLERIIERDELLKLVGEDGPVTLWERIHGWFLRAYLRIRIGLRRILNILFGKRKGLAIEDEKRKKLTLTLFGGRTKFNLGVSVSELMSRPRFRKALKQELGSFEGSNRNDVSLGPEENAERLIRQHIEAGMKRELRAEKERREEEILKHQEEETKLQEKIEQSQKEEKLRHEEEIRELREKLRQKTEDPVRKLMEKNLVELGFIQQEGNDIIPTSSLLERFADLIFQKELKALPQGGTRSGQSQRKLGIYEKAKMRSVFEESRMDIVTTLLNTRINHPGDRHIHEDDIIVYREESAVSSHVVIMFDKSSSMEENERMDAAKRTVMALYRAVRRQKEKDRIDIIGFDTRVSLMDLMSVWKSEPGGFTNIGGALRTARMLFEDSKADIKIAYLITDGLPEAYTDEKGNEVAGEPKICLEHALREAGGLAGGFSGGLNAQLIMILLEPEDETYVEAGRMIVEEAQGRLIITNPKELMHEVLSDYLG